MIEAATLIDAGQLQLFDGVGDLVQVLLGQLQISGHGLQIFMTEQKLDGAQVSGQLPASGSPSCGAYVPRDIDATIYPS
jgi:hypothetical protein